MSTLNTNELAEVFKIISDENQTFGDIAQSYMNFLKIQISSE